MLTAARLSKCVQTDANGKRHKLHAIYTSPNGRFCDSQGRVQPVKVRRVYMLAGLIPPSGDSAEALLECIQTNVILLNAFLDAAAGGPMASRSMQRSAQPQPLRSPGRAKASIKTAKPVSGKSASQVSRKGASGEGKDQKP